MLKFSIIFGLMASIVWRTTPTSCRQTPTPAGAAATPGYTPPSVNEVHATNMQNYMDPTARACDNFYQFACGRWYQQYIDLDYGDTLGLLDHELNRRMEQLLTEEPPPRAAGPTAAAPSDATKSATKNATGGASASEDRAAARRAARSATGSIEVEDSSAVNTTEELFALDLTVSTTAAPPPPVVEESNNATAVIITKLRSYYKSCKKVKPYNLRKYLQLVHPGCDQTWYILASRGGARQWQPDKFDWLLTLARLRLYGLNGVLLKEEVLPRWDDAASNAIYLDKPSPAETRPLGEGVMIELMLDIGQTKRVANGIARDVDAFERALHKLQDDGGSSSSATAAAAAAGVDGSEADASAKEMQLGYLREYMPQIDWLDYLQQLTATAVGVETNLTTTVIVQNVPYMRALLKLLNGVERETLCNYIMLKFLLHLKHQGPAEISRPECVASLRRAMPLAMSHVVGTHFYAGGEGAAAAAVENDAAVHEMFAQLQRKFRETLGDNRLQLPRPVVATLLAKVDGVRLQVGVAPRNITPDYIAAYYTSVDLDAHNFYANQLNLLRLAVEKSHESLAAGTENDSATYTAGPLAAYWASGGSSSSPFYVKTRNLIVVPYGFLQLPVFDRRLAAIFQYGALGFTLAHELLHGFDATGIEYDAAGNMMGPGEEIAANSRFLQGLECVQQQLATSDSLNEKLADFEGFRLAYETYFKGDGDGASWRGVSANSTTASGADRQLLSQFSEQQLFFISFGQFFCGKVHRSVHHQQSAYLEHALDELRVLQTLANFEQFAQAFECERRAKMQSKDRCRLW